jgi:hypothetical protein
MSAGYPVPIFSRNRANGTTATDQLNVSETGYAMAVEMRSLHEEERWELAA